MKSCVNSKQEDIVKYDLLSFPVDKRCFFRVNFLINAAFEHFRMGRLLGGGGYFTVPSQMRRLLEGGV